jgi:hypothetical protein
MSTFEQVSRFVAETVRVLNGYHALFCDDNRMKALVGWVCIR